MYLAGAHTNFVFYKAAVFDFSSIATRRVYTNCDLTVLLRKHFFN